MLHPKLAKGLVTYLTARCEEVEGRVRPFAAPPDDTAPYLTYAGVSFVPHRCHDERDGKQGRTGNGRTRVQIDVWDTNYLRKAGIAFKIVGTQADPGLDGWRAWFPAAGDADRLAVQACFLIGDPSEDAERETDGSEVVWYRTTLEFEFHHAE